MVLIGRRREGMRLTAREQEKLMVVVASDLARRRKNRGLNMYNLGVNDELFTVWFG